MQSPIGEAVWLSWCERNGLAAHFDSATYVSKWAYYGSGWRCRPGSVFVTPTRIIHHSYSVADTIYAIFEPSVRVVVETENIVGAAPIHLGILWTVANGYPEGGVRLAMRDGVHHDLILHEKGPDFRKAMTELGVSWQKQPEPRRTYRRPA